jgi:hypothetical protein
MKHESYHIITFLRWNHFSNKYCSLKSLSCRLFASHPLHRHWADPQPLQLCTGHRGWRHCRPHCGPQYGGSANCCLATWDPGEHIDDFWWPPEVEISDIVATYQTDFAIAPTTLEFWLPTEKHVSSKFPRAQEFHWNFLTPAPQSHLIFSIRRRMIRWTAAPCSIRCRWAFFDFPWKASLQLDPCPAPPLGEEFDLWVSVSPSTNSWIGF